MRWNKASLERLASVTLQSLQEHKLLIKRGSDDQILSSIKKALDKEMEKERLVDVDARKMVDDLEQKQESGSFERYKMLQMVRKKIADERKIPSDKSLLFAKKIVDAPWGDELLDYTDEDQALIIAKQAVRQFLVKAESIDETVRNKIMTLKRGVAEGTPEWDVMYHKYYEEELRRH